MSVKGGRLYLLIVLLGLGLAAASLWMAACGTAPKALAQSGTGILRVAVTGENAPGCGGESSPCRTVQYAVDKALPGEEIRVAGGVYTGVNGYGGLAQVVYVSKTLAIVGGYTTTNWTSPDPVTYPTTLSADGQGRVLYVAGAVSVTVEELRITGGDATGLGGGPLTRDVGGGVYIYEATVTLRDCSVYGNTASSTQWGSGGGLYLWGSSAILNSNTITGNTAGTAVGGHGGGLYLDKSTATLVSNQIRDNVASRDDDGLGGGLYLMFSSAELQDNLFQGNVASVAGSGDGGGLYLFGSQARLEGNTIRGNIASTGWEGKGGGMHLCTSRATLSGNAIVGNTGSTAYAGLGGGLSTCTTQIDLRGNKIAGNTGSTAADGAGGGLALGISKVTMAGNVVISNTATLSPTAIAQGGGVWITDCASFTLTNNLIASNHSGGEGSGLWFNSGPPSPATRGSLLHTTVADNEGVQGVYVGEHVVVALTNTIVSGHNGTGIAVDLGGTASLQATLWYSNGTDTGGGGTLITGTVNVRGDPAFANPLGWDFHLGPGSQALDRGVDAGVTTDLDSQRRPFRLPDLGADEYWPAGEFRPAYLPLILRLSL